MAFPVPAPLAVLGERVVTGPGGMVLRWGRCGGIRRAFGNINSSKENQGQARFHLGCAAAPALPVCARSLPASPDRCRHHRCCIPGGSGVFSSHPSIPRMVMEAAAGAWVPKRMLLYPRQCPAPPRRGPGGPGEPPGSSPGTFGLRLRLSKGVMEVSIPFAKVGGRGRTIVWRGGDPSGAALC